MWREKATRVGDAPLSFQLQVVEFTDLAAAAAAAAAAAVTPTSATAAAAAAAAVISLAPLQLAHRLCDVLHKWRVLIHHMPR